MATQPSSVGGVPSEGVISIGDAEAEVRKQIRDQIIFCLELYPCLMPSMLQVGLGTATPSVLWKAILEELVLEGIVCRTEVPLTSPRERRQTYTLLHLATNPLSHIEPLSQRNAA